jgi:3-oxoacyl-[acyl-carrier protein] reductase
VTQNLELDTTRDFVIGCDQEGSRHDDDDELDHGEGWVVGIVAMVWVLESEGCVVKDLVAIVTGAGHPLGIGAATARRLAADGVRVVVCDLPKTREQLESLTVDVEAANGTALAIIVDITKPEQVQACVDETLQTFGQLDILFNNAGVGIGSAEYLETTREAWDLSLAVNVMGTADFCRAVLPVMQTGGGGVIINNASLAGLGSIIGMPACYTASKHAVVGLTKTIAQEFAKDNIRCVAVCPGSVKTQMYDPIIEAHMENNNYSREEAEAIEVSPIALGYSAEPSEVADVVAFLASPAASYITGVSLPVAGGMPHGL